jgi:hypothetical protein
MGKKAAKPDPVEVIAEALRAFGELTAANVAEKVGMAYPTVTPKLRALEEAGRAERVKNNGQTFWRLVTATAQAPEITADPDTDSGAATDRPDTGTDPNETTAPPAATGAEEPLPALTDPGTGDREPADAPDSAPTDPADAAADTAGAPTVAPAPETAQAPSPEPEPATTTANDPTGGDGADAAQPATDSTPASPAAGKTRRPPGALDRTAMRVAQSNPDREFKVTEMARLIDQADAADGHHYPTASPGAVVLSCDRLVEGGYLTKVNEKPATYKFAKALPANP